MSFLGHARLVAMLLSALLAWAARGAQPPSCATDLCALASAGTVIDGMGCVQTTRCDFGGSSVVSALTTVTNVSFRVTNADKPNGDLVAFGGALRFGWVGKKVGDGTADGSGRVAACDFQAMRLTPDVEGGGGALSFNGRAKAEITGCRFASNAVASIDHGADVGGGAVFVDAGATITGSTFERNIVTDDPSLFAGASSANARKDGGAIYADMTWAANLHVMASHFVTCTANSSYASKPGRGGAVYVVTVPGTDLTSKTAEFSRCVFVDGSAYLGPAVYALATPLLARRCSFKNHGHFRQKIMNEPWLRGGGTVYTADDLTPSGAGTPVANTVDGCTFQEGSWRYRPSSGVVWHSGGGAIWFDFDQRSWNVHDPACDSRQVSECNRGQRPGVPKIHIHSVANSSFNEHSSTEGGGTIMFAFAGNVDGCSFTNGTADAGGGAITSVGPGYYYESDRESRKYQFDLAWRLVLSVQNSTFLSNRHTRGSACTEHSSVPSCGRGGAIRTRHALHARRCFFKDCASWNQGGAVSLGYDAGVTFAQSLVSQCSFDSNVVAFDPVAPENGGPYVRGGALALEPEDPISQVYGMTYTLMKPHVVHLDRCFLTRNRAHNRNTDKLYVREHVNGIGQVTFIERTLAYKRRALGGGICAFGMDATVSASSFVDNRAGWGGAVWDQPDDPTALDTKSRVKLPSRTVAIFYCVFAHNKAVFHAGAIGASWWIGGSWTPSYAAESAAHDAFGSTYVTHAIIIANCTFEGNTIGESQVNFFEPAETVSGEGAAVDIRVPGDAMGQHGEIYRYAKMNVSLSSLFISSADAAVSAAAVHVDYLHGSTCARTFTHADHGVRGTSMLGVATVGGTCAPLRRHCAEGFMPAGQATPCLNGTGGSGAHFAPVVPANTSARCVRQQPLVCDGGKYAADIWAPTKAAGCRVCPRGFYSADNATACSNCSLGWFCEHYANMGIKKEAVCIADVGCRAALADSGRLDCPQFHFCPTTLDLQSCSTAGPHSNGTGIACPQGSSAPIICQPGEYQGSAMRTACEVCAPGSFSNTSAAKACVGCPDGYFQGKAGGTNCSAWHDCAIGEREANSATDRAQRVCAQCPAGYMSKAAQNAIDCEPCASGRFSLAVGAGNCTNCPSGHFTDDSGAFACTPCGIGSSTGNATGRKSCTSCAQASFAAAQGSAFCTACPLGFGTVGTGELYCRTCTACVAGEYEPESCDANLDRQCKACPEGFSSAVTPNAGVCTPCQSGRFAMRQGVTQCTTCPPGAFSDDSGASECKACPHGHSTRNANGSKTCLECSSGTYASTASSSVCKACPFGRFFDDSGASECTACPEGHSTRDATGSKNCLECLAGTYAFAAGSRLCSTCPVNFGAPERGQSSCSECKVCGAGEYEEQTCSQNMNRECFSCPAGYRGEQQGSCTECPRGFFQAKEKETDCQATKEGTFQDRTGRASAKKCAPGAYSAEDGASLCTKCPRGYFQENEQQTRCNGCPLGTFAGLEYASSCTRCNPATAAQKAYTPSRAASACRACGENAVALPSADSCQCIDRWFEVGLLNPAATRNATALACSPAQLGCCRPCRRGTQCESGFLRVKPGFWRMGGPDADLTQPNILACRTEAACPGNTDVVNASSSSEARNDDDDLAYRYPLPGPCRQGHDGVLCGSCVEGWKLNSSLLCVDCTDTDSSDRSMLVLFVAILFFFAVLLLTCFATAPEERQLQKKARAAEHRVGNLGETLDAVSILLPYLQRLAPIPNIYVAIKFPSLVMQALQVLELTYFEVSSVLRLVSPCRLFTSHADNLAMALALLPGMAMAVGLAAVAARLRWHASGGIGTSDGTAQGSSRRGGAAFHLDTSRLRLMGSLLVGIKLAFPGIGSTLLKSLMCAELGHGRGMFLIADPSVQCWSSAEHWTLALLALAGFILLLSGLGALLVVVMSDRRGLARLKAEEAAEAHKEQDVQERARANVFGRARSQQAGTGTGTGTVRGQLLLERARLKAHTTHLQRLRRLGARRHDAVRFLTDPYRPEFWYWFAVELLLSLFFVAGLSVFELYPEAQLAVALLAACGQAILIAYCRPHVVLEDDVMALVAAIAYFTLLLSGVAKLLITLTHEQAEAGVVDAAAAARLRPKLEAANGVINAVFVFSSMFIVLALINAMRANAATLCCASCTGRRAGTAKVTPSVPNSKKTTSRPGDKVKGKDTDAAVPVRRTVTQGGQGQDGQAGRGVAIEDVPQKLTMASRAVLESCSPKLQERYRKAWTDLHAVQVEVMAVGIQAVCRGYAARTTVLAELLSRQKAEQAQAGGGQAARLQQELEAERAKEQKLEAELSSLKKRMVDEHLNRDRTKAADEAKARQIMLSHEREHAEHQVALAEERAEAERRFRARRKSLKRRNTSTSKVKGKKEEEAKEKDVTAAAAVVVVGDVIEHDLDPPPAAVNVESEERREEDGGSGSGIKNREEKE